MENLNHIDLRTSRGRAFKELVASIEVVLGPDLTTMQRLHVQHVAALNLMISEERQLLLEGKEVNHDEFNRLLNTLSRFERGLGLKPNGGKIEDDEEGTIDDLDAYLQSKGLCIDTPKNGRRRLSADTPPVRISNKVGRG